MIDQIILTGPNVFGSGEIDSISLTDGLDGLVITGETDEVGMKFGQIGFDDGGRISSGIA